MGFATWLYSVNLLLPWWMTLPLNLIVLVISLLHWCARVAWGTVLFFASAFDPNSEGFLRKNIVNRWLEI